MAYTDARGEQHDYSVSASVGIYRNLTAYTEAGAVYDLTGKSIICTVKDDKEQRRDYGGEYGSQSSYTLSITDAANGEFDFLIPCAEFTNKEGGRLSYETRLVLENGNKVGIRWGYLDVLERG